MKGFEVLLFMFLCMQAINSSVDGTVTEVVCSKIERQALLSFKKGLTDPTNWLSSWSGDNCCTWKGLSCNNRTGHVIKLNLRQPFQESPEEFVASWDSLLGGEISPSLLELKHLKFLDLSMKNFNGIRIPEFLGSIKSLRYLNLSNAGFGGMVPLQLGNLSNLHYLDLGTNSDLSSYGTDSGIHAENFQWLSHLSFLQYLDLSHVNLSKATDYPQVLNMLPSLTELFLSSCELNPIPDLPAPLVNFTSLTIIDLSENNFNSSTLDWLLRIRGLVSLKLHYNAFVGPIPGGLRNMTSLRVLDLSDNNFNSAIPDWLYNLSSLETLDISKNNLTGSIMSAVGNLTSLARLYLWGNELEGEIPSTLGNLYKLQELDLSANQLSGEIPATLGNLYKLQELDLSTNQLSGEIPATLGNLYRLLKFNLISNNLGGEIPTTLGDLYKLQELCISYNILSGEIPATLGNLYNLQVLHLSNNHLSGTLPDLLGELKSLTDLYLSCNSFFGPIPPSVGRLLSLRFLYLDNNQLNGSIPESLGCLSELEVLCFSNNSLEGEVSEVHFANHTKLKAFYASSNSLSLRVSSNWIPPFQLNEMLMGSCLVGPQFPSWLHTQRNIFKIELSYTGISDEIPAWFWNVSSQIIYLDLSNNQIYGELPRTLKFDSFYPMIFLQSNRLNGQLPHFLSNAVQLDLSNNSFSGPISHFLCQAMDEPSKLEILDLSDNLLSGEIPDCWMNWQSLKAIKLGNNNLTGKVPSSLGSVSWLQSLHLRNNHLSGELPSSLQNCTELQIIDLGKNEFSGSIQTWLGKSLAKLIVLGIQSNNFGGIIPPKLCELSSLQIMDLSHNNISGTIPQCFSNFSAMATKQNSSGPIDISHPSYKGDLVEEVWLIIKGNELQFSKTLKLLMSIDLSDNHFSGEIPKELTSLVGLRSLNLSRNHLIGDIPEKIGDMILLESLDLSINRLSGDIPQSMSELTFLGTLNLSYNSLSGSIPLGTQLQSFDESSFMGNQELCGPPLTQNCSVDGPNNNDRRDGQGTMFQIEGFYVSMALGFVVGFWVVWGPLLYKKSWRYAYFQLLTDMIGKFFG